MTTYKRMMPHERPPPTREGLLQTLDQCQALLTAMNTERAAALRLYRDAHAQMMDNADRLERLAVMLAAALGLPNHGGRTPEDLAAEVEVLLRGLRGEGQ